MQNIKKYTNFKHDLERETESWIHLINMATAQTFTYELIII